MKLQFPAVVYETGEVESVVLRCRSCSESRGSRFPGVTKSCEAGWLSGFRVKMIKAPGTESYNFHAAKTSTKAAREAFSWQTIIHSDVWPCRVVIWGNSWKGKASIPNVYPKRRKYFIYFIYTKKLKKKWCSELHLIYTVHGNLTRRVSTGQRHQRNIALAVFVSVFSPRPLTSEGLGGDGWDGVSQLKIKVDIWRVKMIYFQKGIFIYTSTRGGLEKKTKIIKKIK